MHSIPEVLLPITSCFELKYTLNSKIECDVLISIE